MGILVLLIIFGSSIITFCHAAQFIVNYEDLFVVNLFIYKVPLSTHNYSDTNAWYANIAVGYLIF